MRWFDTQAIDRRDCGDRDVEASDWRDERGSDDRLSEAVRERLRELAEDWASTSSR